MLSPKRRLLLDLQNVSKTLRETLRYRYNKIDTAAFYDECRLRVARLERLISHVDDKDTAGLAELWSALNTLSVRITDIERSHLEEFSWPFAEALKRISFEVCQEVLFLFRAEGGLCSYAVRPEPFGPGVFKRRINSVVFPRALKDSVLLHVIIGHEFGHAALASQPGPLRGILQRLVADSILLDPPALFSWCSKNMGVKFEVEKGYLEQQASQWAQEFFCDLFGLVTMGPCFLPAFQASLETPAFRHPAAQPRYVPSHPPLEARAVALLYAARSLALLFSENTAPADLNQLSSSLDKSFVAMTSAWISGPFAVLDPMRIAEAAIALQQFARSQSMLAFPAADSRMIFQLMSAVVDNVPPVGTYPAAEIGANGQDQSIPCGSVDFRHILLAGWLVALEATEGARFEQINRLCSHAIMQQQGILFWERSAAATAANP
jgi:hypothetical protein